MSWGVTFKSGELLAVRMVYMHAECQVKLQTNAPKSLLGKLVRLCEYNLQALLVFFLRACSTQDATATQQRLLLSE